ncbi:hypothetical protein CM49_02910 [Paenibacillus sp. P1XP2]|nr:hypothetical protein CM49_02910 [Paenibacillus sp. P1XP2]
MFIAYAPRNNPKLAVAVVVPEGGFGSQSAAPIARKIFDAYDEVYGLDGVPKKQLKNQLKNKPVWIPQENKITTNSSKFARGSPERPGCRFFLRMYASPLEQRGSLASIHGDMSLEKKAFRLA